MFTSWRHYKLNRKLTKDILLIRHLLPVNNHSLGEKPSKFLTLTVLLCHHDDYGNSHKRNDRVLHTRNICHLDHTVSLCVLGVLVHLSSTALVSPYRSTVLLGPGYHILSWKIGPNTNLNYIPHTLDPKTMFPCFSSQKSPDFLHISSYIFINSN